MSLNLKNQALIDLQSKGYIAQDNKVISPKGIVLSTRPDESGYLTFNIRRTDGKHSRIRLHRYLAYVKFGMQLFTPGLEVRHLDGNKLNNKLDNLELGTSSENKMDIPKEKRVQSAIHATSFVKKYDHEGIVKRRKEGATIKQLMAEFKVPSKSTISSIINKSLAAKNS